MDAGVNKENLSIYLQEITKAQEEERLRIARELHDVTIQSLVTVLHQLERFLAQNQQFDMPHTRFLLSLEGQIKTILQEVRYLSQDLRPSILDHLGLIPSIEYLVKSLHNHGIKAWLNITVPVFRLRPEVELSVFRVVQEAVNNIIRHSKATEVRVIIACKKEEIFIIIKDNGKGCTDLPQSTDILLNQGKLGLAGMLERIKLIQGRMKLVSLPNRGTTVTLMIPKNNKIS